MQKHWIKLLFFAFFITPDLSVWSQEDDQGGGTAAGIEFFEKHIRPVLSNQCYQCHASDAKQIKGGL
ncbi:MAG: hypothetical protein VX738_09605, partial [Planctomycetota bacterium]|nr:hypothetical protein [Planctomycetota bacterium]